MFILIKIEEEESNKKKFDHTESNYAHVRTNTPPRTPTHLKHEKLIH